LPAVVVRLEVQKTCLLDLVDNMEEKKPIINLEIGSKTEAIDNAESEEDKKKEEEPKKEKTLLDVLKELSQKKEEEAKPKLIDLIGD